AVLWRAAYSLLIFYAQYLSIGSPSSLLFAKTQRRQASPNNYLIRYFCKYSVLSLYSQVVSSLDLRGQVVARLVKRTRSLRHSSLLYFSSTSRWASSHSDWLNSPATNSVSRAALKPPRNAPPTSSH